MVLAILVLMAAAAGDDQGIVAKGSLVVGSSVVSAIVGWLASKRHAEKTAIPQPCVTEQTATQAKWKSNDHSLENLFMRLAVVEQSVAGLKVASEIQRDTLSRMDARLGSLCDCILSGKVKLK